MNIYIKLVVFVLGITQLYAQMGFYRYPKNCQTNCDFSLYWNNKGSETVFTFSTYFGTKPFAQTGEKIWNAFGLSNDRIMGHDDIIVCKTDRLNHSVHHMYNTGMFAPSLMVKEDPLLGLSQINSSLSDNSLTVTLVRQNSLSQVPQYFGLSKKYYIFFAYGTITNNLMNYHPLRASSDEMYFV